MRLLFAWLLLICVAIAAAQSLPRGTEIRLVLLKELNSGGSIVGDEVPFAVAEDVIVNGQVLVREGTLATARVVQARREGALSASIFDKPARLAIELERTSDVNGNPVYLCARVNGKDQRLFSFNRKNTRIPKLEDKQAIETFKTPAKRRVVELLVDTLKGSRSLESFHDNAERNVIMEVARALKLNNTVDLLLNNRMIDLINLGAQLSAPGLGTLLGVRTAVSAVQVTFRAAKEIARIGSHLPGFLSRKFGGRNVDAAIGLQISAFAG